MTQLLLSGPPVLLFVAFSVTVLTASLLVCVLAACTVALTFSAFCAGIGLVVLIPTLFLTTTGATFLFVSGIIGSAAVSKFSSDPRTEGVRSTAKANAAAIGDRVKDASNGSIDLNTATQHFTEKITSTLPKTDEESTTDNPNEQRAREYLARQALGIPDRLEDIPNGSADDKQTSQSASQNVDVNSGSYVQSVADPRSAMDVKHQSSSTQRGGQQIVS